MFLVSVNLRRSIAVDAAQVSESLSSLLLLLSLPLLLLAQSLVRLELSVHPLAPLLVGLW